MQREVTWNIIGNQKWQTGSSPIKWRFIAGNIFDVYIYIERETVYIYIYVSINGRCSIATLDYWWLTPISKWVTT